MPYADPLIRKQKAHEDYLRRKQNPDWVKKLNEYQASRSKLPEVKERLKIAHRRRYSDPEYRLRMLANNSEWDKSNPQNGKKRGLVWRNKNLEKARAKARDWMRRNPTYMRAKENERRALKASVSVNPRSISLFMSGVKSKHFAVCYYCRRKVSTKAIHFDHILALSKGGPHSVENLCVSCARCNLSKGPKLLKDFISLGQQIMEL